jgi:hypothetical protein
MTRKKTLVRLVLSLLVILACCYLFLLFGKRAQAAVEQVARRHCDSRGWTGALLARRYRDTSTQFVQGFQQEFEVEGTDPRMSVWVEVRRPLYYPVWRTHEILESKVDLEPD